MENLWVCNMLHASKLHCVWCAPLWTSIAIYCVCNAAATIGLTQTDVTVIEGRTAEVCVSVTNGTFGREVIVRLSTNNGTATGIYVIVINLVGSS